MGWPRVGEFDMAIRAVTPAAFNNERAIAHDPMRMTPVELTGERRLLGPAV